MDRPKTLSAAFVRTISRPGRYGDGHGGHGLSLLVRPMVNGRVSKTWSQRIRINGQVTNIGLGNYPVVSLSEARAKALKNRRAVEQSRDPRGGGVPTFEEAAERVIAIHAEGWRDGGRNEAQWRSSMATYVYPQIGDKPVDQIASGDVLSILLADGFWHEKRVTAGRVRQRIGAIMKWCIAQGYRTDNPAGDAIAAALPRNGVRQQHHRALPHAEVAAAIVAVRASGAHWATRACIEYAILTAARSGEARLAVWTEIDPDAATWTLPPERMKAGAAHRVPLSTRALDILADARERTGGAGLVFPSVRGKALTSQAISVVLWQAGVDAVLHGFRSSFRDWAAECTDAPREVCELALAHVNSDRVEAAYRRTDLFERRGRLMQDFAEYVDVDA